MQEFLFVSEVPVKGASARSEARCGLDFTDSRSRITILGE